jgi:four helix bundle protein
MKEKITNFSDLKCWQLGHLLVIDIYKITKTFPSYEVFGLTGQVRRAIISVTSNIAEGFSRRTAKDKTHFYSMAMGSISEVLNQLLIARDLSYITESDFLTLKVRLIEVQKMISGLIKSANTRVYP